MRNELLKGLTEEQVEKVKACRSADEIISLAKSEGVELTDEQLAAVSGGSCLPSFMDPYDCPKCNSDDVVKDNGTFRCNKCGYEWTTC